MGRSDSEETAQGALADVAVFMQFLAILTFFQYISNLYILQGSIKTEPYFFIEISRVAGGFIRKKFLK